MSFSGQDDSKRSKERKRKRKKRSRSKTASELCWRVVSFYISELFRIACRTSVDQTPELQSFSQKVYV